MFRKGVKLLIILVVIALKIVVLFGEGYAAGPDVTLVVNPKDTEIYAGSGKIVITVDASGKNLTFTWKLSGPGKLEGEGAAAFYIPPEKIDRDSEFAIVTATVREPSGQATIKSVTFSILPGPAKTVTPTPESTPTVKKGMSKGTKVALLGLGAAAALAGGIALAAISSGTTRYIHEISTSHLPGIYNLDDNGMILQKINQYYKYTRQGDIASEDTPFTGMFTYSRVESSWTTSKTFNLIQNGSSITGTYEETKNAIGCCIVHVTTNVTGTADAKTATLDGERKENTCECIKRD